ncbi:unnamed protein product [Rotaria sp. Silwood1]|nr:unnamed protein product [Rotaria sp. Silwood1]
MSDKIRPLFKGYGDGRNPLCGQINLLSIKTPKTSSFIDNQPQTLNKKRPAPACFSDDKIDTSISHHYRPPFGKQQQPQTQQEPLSFRTARDQLEIDEARTKTNGIIVKKSLGMHSVAQRSIYNRYVDPTGGRQTQGDSNQQMIPPPPTPSAPVLQINQSNNTEPSKNKLEESGRAKHIDPKLIAMITRDANRPLFSGLAWPDLAYRPGQKPKSKFIIFENFLQPLKSLSLNQSKQLINIIHDLYNCNIIHRDIRPQNLMLEKKSEYLKLIDFGFAVIFENDQKTKVLPIQGGISYGGLKFLKFCSKFVFNSAIGSCYEYEQTFDLPCAINFIMFMTNNDVKEKLTSFKKLSLQDRIKLSYRYWRDQKVKNKNYADLLNLIDNSQESPNFDLIIVEVEKYFNSLHSIQSS